MLQRKKRILARAARAKEKNTNFRHASALPGELVQLLEERVFLNLAKHFSSEGAGTGSTRGRKKVEEKDSERRGGKRTTRRRPQEEAGVNAGGGREKGKKRVACSGVWLRYLFS